MAISDLFNSKTFYRKAKSGTSSSFLNIQNFHASWLQSLFHFLIILYDFEV